MEWYGDEQYVIATDTRNNTPVLAVTYVSIATEVVHVFCKFGSLWVSSDLKSDMWAVLIM
jgi:hypothetical protein